MKQLIFKYFIFIFTLGILTSCNSDEFLEEKNPNLISTDSYWRNLAETKTGLSAVYQTLHKPAILNKFEEMLRSDMGYPGYGRPNPNNTEDFYLHLYNGSTLAILNKWQDTYLGIFRANQVIEALNNIKETATDQAEWTSQMAQARFFRGLFHFYLYTTFNNGSIIIRDAVPATNEDFSKALSPASDVISFVREDLEYAYANLYKRGEYPDNDLAKVTSGAAATILGTSYLYELDYSKAMVYFDDVINNHGYSLETDLTKMFTTAGEFNSESILEINFSEENARLDLAPWDGDSGTNWVNVRTAQTRSAVGPAWIVNAYKSEPMDPLDSRNYYTDPNTSLVSLRSVPLRNSSMMAVVDDNETTYYLTGTTSEYGRFGGTNWGFGWWKKYTNSDIVSSESLIPGGQAYSTKNITLNRLADVLLMQAECKIKTGDVDGAIKLINQIRKRWGLVLLGRPNGDTTRTYDKDQSDPEYTADELMQRLMRVEKPLEMGAEGHDIRFLDFQRWKKSDNYGFKDRLKELSNEVYYGVDYTYTKRSNNQTVTRGNFPSLVNELPTVNSTAVDYEYDTPYLNYDEAKNGTYPIPFAEVNSNPNIN
ncbi:RagB/SusD family nutrient uptake outer membrane protein [Polaribacter sp. Z014]|uniref:RagB/SusD family nutrient uptake outer membrane protein n=1 Tax=unclassified Polaribacter TaxID=196858 RepID=UPI00193C1305|nr:MULTISPECIES: RagB/SusD family nutrient uptake outer membrane protein [unclassified Polaribacter]MCL7762938.1 RagB/SusD family nutrient uptake outer membrane protein [Polaribacter sp. Z014]QVY65634.1 RagB/SusD family nutrient uptake outer membrane protein [Polaribacter sp. Q13]